MSSNDDKGHRDSDQTESISKAKGQHGSVPFDRLGNFRIEAIISAGGMGTVYRAYDESMKRHVAIKVLHPSFALSQTTQQRFARETWISGQLEHPSIVRVYSRGEDCGLQYFSMELADGGSLADYIKHLRSEIPPNSDVSETVRSEYIRAMLTKFIDLAQALEYVHERGYVHRDIKPHNILLSGPDKRLKLTDFGIAHSDDMTKMTQAGDFIGTIKYMSPELLTAHRATVDKRTDIYSLGVTLYEALTLTLPYDGESQEQYVTEILSGHSVPARRRNKRIARDLETVMMTALHQEPTKRYQSAAELAADLRNLLEARPIRARREPVPSRIFKTLRRNRRTAFLLLASIVLMAIAGVWMALLYDHSDKSNRIVRTMKAALATKTSPFALDSEWEALSKNLYADLGKGKVDTSFKLLAKIYAVPHYEYLEYSLASKASLYVGFADIEVFGNSCFDPSYGGLGILYCKCLASLHGDDYVEFASFASVFGCRNASRNVDGGFLTKRFGTIEAGRHEITVKRITSTYAGVRMYLPFDRRFKEMSFSISPKGDSLVPFTSVNRYSPVILTQSDWSVASPVTVDTICDTLSMWVFDSYPEEFPRKAEVVDGPMSIRSSLRIDEFTIVKKDSKRYVSYFTGVLDTARIKSPVAANFEVSPLVHRTNTIEGMIRISNRGLRIAYDTTEVSRIGGSRSSAQGIVLTIGCSTSGIGRNAEAFSDLVRLGAVKASLVLTPSRDVARVFGDVYEYYGDTLKYEITVRAFDSSKVVPSEP